MILINIYWNWTILLFHILNGFAHGFDTASSSLLNMVLLWLLCLVIPYVAHVMQYNSAFFIHLFMFHYCLMSYSLHFSFFFQLGSWYAVQVIWVFWVLCLRLFNLYFLGRLQNMCLECFWWEPSSFIDWTQWICKAFWYLLGGSSFRIILLTCSSYWSLICVVLWNIIFSFANVHIYWLTLHSYCFSLFLLSASYCWIYKSHPED